MDNIRAKFDRPPRSSAPDTTYRLDIRSEAPSRIVTQRTEEWRSYLAEKQSQMSPRSFSRDSDLKSVQSQLRDWDIKTELRSGRQDMLFEEFSAHQHSGTLSDLYSKVPTNTGGESSSIAGSSTHRKARGEQISQVI